MTSLLTLSVSYVVFRVVYRDKPVTRLQSLCLSLADTLFLGFLRRANGTYGAPEKIWLRTGRRFALRTAIVVKTMARTYLPEPFPKFHRNCYSLNKGLRLPKAAAFYSSGRHGRQQSTS